MKTFAVLAVAALCLGFAAADQSPFWVPDNELVLNDDMIAEINNGGASWTAGRNPRFEGMTMKDARTLLGTRVDRHAREYLPSISYPHVEVPDSFDSRTQWPNCVHPIRNQEQCGSCWAFGATEALSDRFCIATSGSTNVVLSPEDLVSCDTTDYGCNGGYLSNAWQYMATKGVVSDACFPYGAGSGVAPACPSGEQCPGSGSWTKYYVESGTINTFTDVASIENAIYTNGPVEGAFTVYQDFFSYTSGVYTHQSGGVAGGHAIKIIGWGSTSDGTDYWIVANSWGSSWGMDGYFWIKKGVDECGIEDDVVAGSPKTN